MNTERVNLTMPLDFNLINNCNGKQLASTNYNISSKFTF